MISRIGLIFMICITNLLAYTTNGIVATDNYYDFDADNGLTAYAVSGYYRLWDTNYVGRTYHPLQNGGDPWSVYTNAPYSGSKCFAVDVVPLTTNEPARSENIICHDINTNDTRYFRYAFRVDSSAAFQGAGGHLWISQSWQDDYPHLQNLILSLSEDRKLQFRLRYGANDSDGIAYVSIWTSPWDVVVGQWYSVLITYKPFTPNSAGVASLQMMDNATGIWFTMGSYSAIPSLVVNPVGVINFKLGGYLGCDRTWLGSYDSIVYGKTWLLVTRGNLVGYAKKILDVGYRDTDSSTRGNNITRYGNAYWNGTWLTLDGNGDYASMNVATSTTNGLEDFNVANYLRIDTQFQVTAAPTGTAGVVYMGNSTAGSGVFVDPSRKMYFSVAHPDGTATWYPSAGIQTYTNTVYTVQASYNRFGDIKLVVNGATNVTVSAGKPILKPDQVWIGRRKNYYFNGIIDNVIIYNNHAGGN